MHARLFIVWIGLCALLGTPVVAHAQACDTGLNSDCDGDGFSPQDGDCDDVDSEVHPGKPEICEDELDNNCDGFFDEECDIAARQGSLQGGGGCTGGDQTGINPSGQAVFLPLLLLGWRRRP